jgi:2-C-methyl-D-erythritol 4-phosphate cytidylyltransferase
VRAALDAATAGGGELPAAVIVHDAARPLAPPVLFDELLAALGDADGVVAAAPVVDTVKRAGADLVVRETPDRAALWAVQTPQVFRTAALAAALDADAAALAGASDDAALVERAGGTVRIFPWLAPNPKVTTPHDLAVAERLLRQPPPA